MIGSWEKVMRSMDVEPSEQQVGEESLHPSISVVGRQDGVLSEVFDPLGALTPQLLQPMAAEKHSIEDQPEEPINEHMQLQSIPEIPANVVECQQNGKREQVPQVWPSPLDDGNNNCFEQEVEGLKEDERQDDDYLSIHLVFRFISKEISDGLQRSSFVVQLEVRINVVTDTVHHLPFVVRKARGTVEVLKVVVSVMNEIVADPHHSNQQNRTASAEDVRQEGLLLGIHRVCSKADKRDQEAQDYESVCLGLALILNLLYCHFLQKLFFNCAVKALFLEGESRNRIFGIADIVLRENISGFPFVEVMDDEKLCHVLSFRHDQPLFTSRVPGNEVSQVVEFVFDDPIIGSITAPKLGISFFFFLHPNLRTSFYSTRRHRLSIRLHFC